MTLSQVLSVGAVLLDVAIVLALVPRVVIQRRESAATLAWVLLILGVPLLGALLYATIGIQRLHRRRARRRRARQRGIDDSLVRDRVRGGRTERRRRRDHPLCSCTRARHVPLQGRLR